MNTEQDELELLFNEFVNQHGDSRVIDIKDSLRTLLEKMAIHVWDKASDDCCGCLYGKLTFNK